MTALTGNFLRGNAQEGKAAFPESLDVRILMNSSGDIFWMAARPNWRSRSRADSRDSGSDAGHHLVLGAAARSRTMPVVSQASPARSERV